MRDHLADDGLLIITIGDPALYGLVTASGGTPIRKLNEFDHPENGNRVICWWQVECNLETQIRNYHYIYEEIDERGGTVSRHHAFECARYTFRYEMQYLVESCGFTVLELYGDFRRGPFRSGGQQVWLLAKAGNAMDR